MAVDKIFSTQFPELGFTHVVGTQVGVGEPRQISEWRFVDLTDEKPRLIGASYPTREMLVSDVVRFAFFYGCANAHAPEIGDAIDPQWKNAVFMAWLRNDQATLERLREMIDTQIVVDVCMDGNPAINGCCGDPDCVCATRVDAA